MIFPKGEPLTDDEIEYLESVLEQFPDHAAMNVEELDGFFTALLCGPRTGLPSEYLPEVFGGHFMTDCPAVDTLDAAQKILGLLMQHWNDVIIRLEEDEIFIPMLYQDEDGTIRGNYWSAGFLRGVQLHQSDWDELLEDKNQGGYLVPILALAHEHHPDPEIRPLKGPVTDEKRELLIAGLSAAAMEIYKYFKPRREQRAKDLKKEKTVRRNAPKPRRNDPCPCGSGKKYKVCCGTGH